MEPPTGERCEHLKCDRKVMKFPQKLILLLVKQVMDFSSIKLIASHRSLIVQRETPGPVEIITPKKKKFDSVPLWYFHRSRNFHRAEIPSHVTREKRLDGCRRCCRIDGIPIIYFFFAPSRDVSPALDTPSRRRLHRKIISFIKVFF